ncbi:hypothetical protein LCGC14_0634380 [marine sediment metagenome]|uniref:Uncharacterized protein n=1 Tax=marine sediment metagenome TaxID=412755 RepID=A0A0F9TMK8_9ZZZZ
MSWLLKPEEIEAAIASVGAADEEQAIAKAQLRHVVEMMEAVCPHSFFGNTTARYCPTCMEQLRREAGLE